MGDTPRTDRANNADVEREFQVFYAAHYAQLVAQGTMLSDSLQEAEDAAQEACMAAMAKWDTIRSPYHWTKKAMSRKLVRDRQMRRARWYRRLLPQSPPTWRSRCRPAPRSMSGCAPSTSWPRCGNCRRASARS
nr:sigma factor [Streptomyces avermitilis]